MTLGLILKPLASGPLFFFDVRVFNSFAETNHSHVKLEHFGDIKVISVGLMRSVSGKWNIEVLCHLYSPPLGVWVRPPQLHINALPPFSVKNGTFHIL